MNLIKIIVFLSAFIFLISPSAIGINNLGALFSIPFAIVGLCVFLKKKLSLNYILTPLAIVLCSLIYLLVLNIVHVSSDLSIISRYFLLPFVIISAFFFAWILCRLYGSEALVKLSSYCAFFALFHALIFIMMYIVPAFANAVMNFTGGSTDGYRMPGLVGIGSDASSMNLVLLVIPLMLLFFARKIAIHPMIVLLILSIVFVASLAGGRTGFIVAFLISIFSYVTFSLYRALLGGVKKSFILIIVSIPISIAAIIAMIPYIEPFVTDVSRGYNDPIVRAMQPFRNYFLRGEFYMGTLDALTGRMLIFPEGFVGVLFGVGEFGRDGELYLHTDIGYLRMWFGAGLAGSVIIYSLYIVPALHIILSSTTKVGFYQKLLFICIVLFGFIGHYKIIYLTTIVYTFIFFVFYFLILFINNKATVRD